ncbi:MAG: hypothetical protein HYY79_09170 [Betaproteobacteria bacterium]|nr:hypothetical protein [Betaproteobacteria bacterium]
MTRPPFAEFSSLAIRELTAWIGGNALWSERLSDVLQEHFLPVAEQAGLDPEEAWEVLGEFTGSVYGAALEDLCTRRYDDPPQSLVADFLRKRAFRLPPLAKSYLEALRDSAPGVYEAMAVRPGHGVMIRDLLIGGAPIDVIEVSGSRQIVQWDRLAARVVEHGGKRVFTGAVLPLRTDHSKALIDELRSMVHGLAEKAGVSAEAFRGEVTNVMREAAPRLGGLHIAQILASRHRPLPKLVNREGDPYEFVEARYALVSGKRRDVIARLDAESALQCTGARPAKWDWVGNASEHPRASPAEDGLTFESHPDGDTGRVVLASVTLSGSQLELSVNSRRRLESARAFIEPLLAGLIGEPEVAIKSVEDAMAENRDGPAPRRRSVPKRVEQEVTQRFLDRHYRTWLDEKIPALDGKSPREAVRDFEGREQLVALLKQLENLEARRAKDTGMGYDARWLWRELGIEHLRR